MKIVMLLKVMSLYFVHTIMICSEGGEEFYDSVQFNSRIGCDKIMNAWG